MSLEKEFFEHLEKTCFMDAKTQNNEDDGIYSINITFKDEIHRDLYLKTIVHKDISLIKKQKQKLKDVIEESPEKMNEFMKSSLQVYKEHKQQKFYPFSMN